MKKFRLLMILTLILGCFAALCSCAQLPQLKTPDRLEIDEATLVLSWGKVDNARLYTLLIESEGKEARELMTSKTEYGLSSFEEGDYSIRVKAVGKEEEQLDSEWSEPIEFTREHEPGMVFTLNKAGTEYEVTDKGNATGHIVIPEKYRGKPVTSIGRKAFFNKSDVTAVTFGKNITTVGEFAFANCSYLTSLTLSDGLTTLGESAFASCRLLEGTLVLPEGVKVIPGKAFAYCGSLEAVVFGSNVSTIGANAFTDCKKLTAIELPASVTEVGEYAFASCTAVTKLTLGSGLQQVAPYAFSELSLLEELVLPDTVKTVGEGAFYNCEALSSITLGTGIEMLDLGAFLGTAVWESATNEVYVGRWFLGCKDNTVTSLNLREDTVGIANFALFGNKTLTDLILPNSVKIIGNAAFAGTKLNNVVIGSGVEVIGEQAFATCQNLSTVILGSYDFDEGELAESSLKKIGDYAFKDCLLLDSIEIPSSVTVVGTHAFRDSGIFKKAEDVVYAGKWLVDFTEKFSGEVNVKNGTVGIANYAFYKCTALTSISMPNTVKYVGRAAFYKCTELTSVTLPNTLEVIEEYTFYHCDSLKLFSLPPMLRSIGRSAFYKCATSYPTNNDGSLVPDDGDETLVIPGSVSSIGDYAFYGCGQQVALPGQDPVTNGIDVLEIGSSVESIGKYAFYGFVSLKKVVMSDAVRTIGEKAFYKCTSLEQVSFGNGLQTIGTKAFYKCQALVGISLPDSLLVIGDYAFYKCEALSFADLGDGVSEIGGFAFYGCSEMKNLTLPESLITVGRQAFRNCKSLTGLVLSNNITTLGAHTFYGCDNLTLFVESNEAASGWDKYWNSSYRPTLWGCILSEDKDYVVSFARGADSIVNKNQSNVFSAPIREGYTFVGWNTNSSATDATYTMETFMEIAEGRKLFAIWAEAAEVQ